MESIKNITKMLFLNFFFLLFFFQCNSNVNVITIEEADDLNDILPSIEDNTIVVLSKGTWHPTKRVTIREKTNITIQGSGDLESIIDCSNEDILEGNSDWESEGNEIYSTDYNFFECPGYDVVYGAYYTGSGEDDQAQLWTYCSLDQLEEGVNGEGFFFDEDEKKIYLWTNEKFNPGSTKIVIGCDVCLTIDYGTDVYLKNFMVKNGGITTLRSKNSENLYYSNLEIVGGLRGVSITYTENANFVDSYIRGYINMDWYWEEVKQSCGMEGTGIQFKRGYGGEIARNEVTGFFNGIMAVNQDFEEKEQCNNGLKVHHNTIHKILDDALEIEYCVIDVEVYKNLVYDTYTAFSMAPVITGPIYVYQNLLISTHLSNYQADGTLNSNKVYKFINGDESPENIKLYHNTAISLYGCLFSGENKNEMKNSEFYNNIFYGYFNYLDSDYEDLTQTLIKYSGKEDDGNVYDGNLFYMKDFENRNWDQYVFKQYNTYSDDTYYYSLKEALEANPADTWEINGFGDEIDPVIDIGSFTSPNKYIINNKNVDFKRRVEIPSSWPLDDILTELEDDAIVGVNNFFGDDSDSDDEDDDISGVNGKKFSVLLGIMICFCIFLIF